MDPDLAQEAPSGIHSLKAVCYDSDNTLIELRIRRENDRHRLFLARDGKPMAQDFDGPDTDSSLDRLDDGTLVVYNHFAGSSGSMFDASGKRLVENFIGVNAICSYNGSIYGANYVGPIIKWRAADGVQLAHQTEQIFTAENTLMVSCDASCWQGKMPFRAHQYTKDISRVVNVYLVDLETQKKDFVLSDSDNMNVSISPQGLLFVENYKASRTRPFIAIGDMRTKKIVAGCRVYADKMKNVSSTRLFPTGIESRYWAFLTNSFVQLWDMRRLQEPVCTKAIDKIKHIDSADLAPDGSELSYVDDGSQLRTVDFGKFYFANEYKAKNVVAALRARELGTRK